MHHPRPERPHTPRLPDDKIAMALIATLALEGILLAVTKDVAAINAATAVAAQIFVAIIATSRLDPPA